MRLLILLTAGFIWGMQNAPQTDIATRAEQVYEKLKKALGDHRIDWPEFEVVDRKLNSAAYRSLDGKLVMEPLALEICEQMGDQTEAAIAFLLGHELTHFYQHKDWGGHTCWQHGMSIEAEADIHGAFIAYLAGYDVRQAAPEVLDRIYQKYKFDKKMKGYPSLDVRQQIVQGALEKASILQTIYDHAGILMALGFHKEAAFCYEYLLKQVKTQELYNNIGATLLAAAVAQEKQEKKFRYQYPIELHSNFGINAQQPRGTTGIINTPRLLGMAKNNFDKAIELDPNDFSARLNLACTVNLSTKEEQQLVWDYISNAEKQVKTPLQLSKLSVLKGIIYAMTGKDDLAAKEFSNAAQKDSHMGIGKMVEYNNQVLEGGLGFVPPPPFSRSRDMIEGIRLRNYGSIQYDYTITFPQLGELNSSIAIKNFDKSCLVQVPLHKRVIVLHSTRNKDIKTAKGINVGHNFDKLSTTYPTEKCHTVNTSDGFLVVYPSLRLFFKINKANKIAQWGIFMTHIKS